MAYFGAGPAPLPTVVLEEAAKVLLNYQNTGIGLVEHSHRSPLAVKILDDARQNLRTFMSIPDTHEILFMQGGGTGEFSAVAYNFVNAWLHRTRERMGEEAEKSTEQGGETALAAYVRQKLRLSFLVTGSWSLKASQEASRLYGSDRVHISIDARKYNDGKFGTVPDCEEWDQNYPAEDPPAFLYYCDNETVDGVEFPANTAFGLLEEAASREAIPLVADMSSNILSRRVDISKHALIFGGAQKNIGCTGLTIVIVQKKYLDQIDQPSDMLRALHLPIGPIIMDYPTIAKNNSLYNTLSIFDVWMAGDVIRRLNERYQEEKVGGMEKLADEKAALLYAALDGKDRYRVVPQKNGRSRMNICFRVMNGGHVDDAAEKQLLAEAEKQGFFGLKGHRSVGGLRISNYNSITLPQATALSRFIGEWASRVEPKVNGHAG